MKAEYGFFLLGRDAKPVWPTLIAWTSSQDSDLRRCALSVSVLQSLVPIRKFFFARFDAFAPGSGREDSR